MRVACVGSCFYVDKAFFCIRSLFLRLYCHFVFGVWCVYLLFNHVSIKKKFIKKLYWKIIFFWFSFSLFTELIDTKTWQIGGWEWSECFICLRVCLLQFWRRTSGWRVNNVGQNRKLQRIWKIAMVPYARFIQITISSDYRRVWTANLLHSK